MPEIDLGPAPKEVDLGPAPKVNEVDLGPAPQDEDRELSDLVVPAIKAAPEKILGMTAAIGKGAAMGVRSVTDTINKTNKMIGVPESKFFTDLSATLGGMEKSLDAEIAQDNIGTIPKVAGEIAGGFYPMTKEWGKMIPGTAWASLKAMADARDKGEDWTRSIEEAGWGGVKRAAIEKALDLFGRINLKFKYGTDASNKLKNEVVRRGVGGVFQGGIDIAPKLINGQPITEEDVVQTGIQTLFGVTQTNYRGKPAETTKQAVEKSIDTPTNRYIVPKINVPETPTKLENEFAKYHYEQDFEDGNPPVKYYTVMKDIPGHPAGSDIEAESLRKAGVPVPGERSNFPTAEITGDYAAPGPVELPAKLQFKSVDDALEHAGLNKPLVPGSDEAAQAAKIREDYSKAQLAGQTIEPAPTQESIGKKVEEHINNLVDLRTSVADPANKARAAKAIEAYKAAKDAHLEDNPGDFEGAKNAAQKAQARITSDVPDVTPPNLSVGERQFLFEQNDKMHKADGYAHLNTADALTKWLAGKIPEPADFQYLAKILGIKNTTKLLFKMRGVRGYTGFDYTKMAISMAKVPFTLDPQYIRQTGAVMVPHPVEWLKGLGVTGRSYLSGKYSAQKDAELLANPNHQDAIDHGMTPMKSEPWASPGVAADQFEANRPVIHTLHTLDIKGETPVGKVAAKATNIAAHTVARVTVASERALITATNYLMQNLWDLKMNEFYKSGEVLTPAQMKDLLPRIKEPEIRAAIDRSIRLKKNYADSLNTMMKLFKFQSKEGKMVQGALNYPLFSATYTLSRPAMLVKLYTNEGSRKELAGAIAGTIGKMFLISALAKTVGMYWKDKEGNPVITSSFDLTSPEGALKTATSSDLGYVRSGVGKWDFGLGGGDTSWYTDLFRLVTGHYANQAGVLKEAPRWETLAKMAVKRENAIIGAISEVVTGRDFVGNKTFEVPDWEKIQQEGTSTGARFYGTVGGALIKTQTEEKTFLFARQIARTFGAQILGDIFDASINLGWGGIAATGVTDALSGGAQIYPEPASISKAKAQNEASQIEYQKDWDNLSPRQQKTLERTHKEIGQWEQQAKFERSERDQAMAIKPKELKLSRDVKNTLREFEVPYPAVSRDIGSKFYLNDDRFKAYQKLAADTLAERVSLVKSAPSFQNATTQIKQRLIQREVDRSKEIARRQLLRQFETEANTK